MSCEDDAALRCLLFFAFFDVFAFFCFLSLPRFFLLARSTDDEGLSSRLLTNVREDDVCPAGTSKSPKGRARVVFLLSSLTALATAAILRGMAFSEVLSSALPVSKLWSQLCHASSSSCFF